MIYAATNNAIKEYSYEIKNSETPDKIVFLMINTSILLYIYIYIYTIYFKKNVFSKFALIFQIFQYLVIFVILGGGFLSLFCVLWLEWVPLQVFQKLEPNYIYLYTVIYILQLYITIYLQIFFQNLPEDCK